MKIFKYTAGMKLGWFCIKRKTQLILSFYAAKCAVGDRKLVALLEAAKSVGKQKLYIIFQTRER